MKIYTEDNLQERIEEIDEKIEEIREKFEDEKDSIKLEISDERISQILSIAVPTKYKITKQQKEKIIQHLGDTPQTQELFTKLTSGEGKAIVQEINHLLKTELNNRTREFEKELIELERTQNVYDLILQNKSEAWGNKLACCVLENWLRDNDLFVLGITNRQALELYLANNKSISRRINPIVWEKFIYGITTIDEMYSEEYTAEELNKLHYIDDIEEIVDAIYSDQSTHEQFESYIANKQQTTTTKNSCSTLLKILSMFVLTVFVIVVIVAILKR